MLRFTAKGRIQVWDGEVLVSSHVQEREAYERIAGLAPGKYTVTFPVIEVVSSGAFKSVYSTSSESGRVEARGMAVQVVRLLSDTTPPAVPSDFSASAATATSVTLTLTANVESDFSNYVLERSSDNIGWGYLKSFTGTSTTDTVDVSGSTYYYRAFSIDTRGNRSAYTAVKSAGPYTVSFAWNGTIPNVTFNRGNAQNFDLSPYIIGSSPVITVETGTLPTGVTLNSSLQRLQYDGTSATSTAIVATGISLRLSSSPDADWLSRSTASGVFYATNFTYRDTAKTQLVTSTADMIAMAFQTGNTSRLVWDTSLKLSGNGCLRLNMPAGSYNDTGWTFAFDGFGNTEKTVSKSQFYLQFAYYADSVQNNFNYGDTNNYGGKICIVQAPDKSANTGEVVFRRWVEPGGFVAAYSIPTSQSQVYYNHVSAFSRGLLNNLYDANHYGGSFGTPTTESQWRQRHGYMSAGTVTNPDYANAPRIISNTWMTVEMYLDLVNDCMKIWMAPYGEEPKLIIGKNAGDGDLPPVGTSDQSNLKPRPLYSGAQLTNYANTPTAWPSTSTFVCYDELIASDNPIPFPGGYTLPFPGTDTVTGWPWTGTVFRG